jgi:hypothetical protein
LHRHPRHTAGKIQGSVRAKPAWVG